MALPADNTVSFFYKHTNCLRSPPSTLFAHATPVPGSLGLQHLACLRWTVFGGFTSHIIDDLPSPSPVLRRGNTGYIYTERHVSVLAGGQARFTGGNGFAAPASPDEEPAELGGFFKKHT